MYAAEAALGVAMELAAENGIAIASLRNCSHIGRLGHYTELAAVAGQIGLATFGDGEAGGHLAAPFGSKVRALSTNPYFCGSSSVGTSVRG